MIQKQLRLWALLLFVWSPFLLFAQSLPEKTFEAFWKSMDENYAFFKLKEIDWDEVYQTYRSKVTANTSDEDLFELMKEILEPFQDGHINLATADKPKKRFSGGRPSAFKTQFPNDSLVGLYFDLVEQHLTNAGFSDLNNVGPILSDQTALYNHSVYEHCASDRLAYVKVSWFFHDWQLVQKLLGRGKDRKNFLADFDQLLLQYKDKEGMILDLRNNIGGVSGYPERLVGRFAKAPFIGEYTASRKKEGHEVFTFLKPTKVKPAKTVSFSQPVVLLVNGETVSAAEEFVQMMRGLPRVTIIGTPTQGALSDIYEEKLPNDWTLTFSNMRFYDRNMECWENKGIPVDIEIANHLDDLKKGVDPVLQSAIDLLTQ